MLKKLTTGQNNQNNDLSLKAKYFFLMCPFWPPVFYFFLLMTKPGSGTGINTVIAMKPFPYSTG